MPRRKYRKRSTADGESAVSDRDPFRALATAAEAIVARHGDALQSLEAVPLPADLKKMIEAELADRLVREIRALCGLEAVPSPAEQESPGAIAARAIIEERQRALNLSGAIAPEVTR